MDFRRTAHVIAKMDTSDLEKAVRRISDLEEQKYQKTREITRSKQRRGKQSAQERRKDSLALVNQELADEKKKVAGHDKALREIEADEKRHGRLHKRNMDRAEAQNEVRHRLRRTNAKQTERIRTREEREA